MGMYEGDFQRTTCDPIAIDFAKSFMEKDTSLGVAVLMPEPAFWILFRVLRVAKRSWDTLFR